MLRKIIEIEEEKCTGCGICAEACHEGAIIMENGKAKLIRDDYCDGLGDCLPACPAGAIHFVEREAAAYDADAVRLRQEGWEKEQDADRKETQEEESREEESREAPCGYTGGQIQRGQPKSKSSGQEVVCGRMSELSQWPVQIKLAPLHAPYFQNAKLLIAADCTAYAYGDFHRQFIRGHVTLIGCPKLDGVDYSEKLAQILMQNEIKSITVVRMEVPCCGGIELAVKKALGMSGKQIPWQVAVISTDGKILESTF